MKIVKDLPATGVHLFHRVPYPACSVTDKAYANLVTKTVLCCRFDANSIDELCAPNQSDIPNAFSLLSTVRLPLFLSLDRCHCTVGGKNKNRSSVLLLGHLFDNAQHFVGGRNNLG